MELVAPAYLALLIRHVLIIANPASRRGHRLSEVAHQAVVAHGVACDTVLTERAGHAAELASARGSEYHAIFVLGGDGTVMEVASALAGTGRPIGILPAGTGNLLARALSIPLDVRKAVPALLEGDTHWIDMGRLPSGHGFAIAAGVGIDAAMVAETPVWLKRHLGVLAYTLVAGWAAIRAVVRRDFFRVLITVDGRAHERRAAAVMIANFGAVLGNRIVLGPGIEADDGLFDLCVYSPDTVRDALRIVWRMLRKDFEPDSAMFYERGRQLRVETDPPRVYQADGELLGTTPFAVTVEPRAALLLVPRQSLTPLPRGLPGKRDGASSIRANEG